MKKWICFVLTCLMLFMAVSCGEKTPENPVQKAIDTRLADLQAKFEDYIPDELVKIENAKTATNGDYVLFVVANDPQPAVDAFHAYFTAGGNALDGCLQAAMDATTYVDEMYELSGEKITDFYAMPEDVTDSRVFVSASGATAEELCVFYIGGEKAPSSSEDTAYYPYPGNEP